MGGFGSGRPVGRLKCETCISLDVRTWARMGILKAGNQFKMDWTDGSSIGIEMASDDQAVLQYAVSGDPRRQSIDLERTACNYGGQRTWFVAPCCGNRAAKLFMRQGRFACRTCQRLAYSTQSLDYIQRQHRAIHRVTRNLANGGDKPKGMHWSTFSRLQDQIETIDRQLNIAADARLCAVIQRLGAFEFMESIKGRGNRQQP